MAGKKYFYELDILRGIACLLVYFSPNHLPIYRITGVDILGGAYGVYLFFVISGFIIAVGYNYQIEYFEEFNLKE